MRAYSIDLRAYGFNIRKYDTGEIVINQKTPEHDPAAPNFNGHRGELHAIVYDYAIKELGIPIRLGQKIRAYFEEGDEAGIVLETGEKVSGPRCGCVPSDSGPSGVRRRRYGNLYETLVLMQ